MHIYTFICTGCSQLSSLVSIALSTPLLHLPSPEDLLSQLYVRKEDGRLLLGGLDLSGTPSSGGLQGGGGGRGMVSKNGMSASVIDMPRVIHTILATLLSVSRTVYLAPYPHTHTVHTTRISNNNNNNNNNNSNNGTNNMNNNDNRTDGNNGNDGDGIIQKTCYIQAGHQLFLSFLDLPPLGQCEIRLIDSSNSSSSKDDNKNIKSTPYHDNSSNNVVIEVQYNTINLSGDRDRSIATLTTTTSTTTTATTTNSNNTTIGTSDYICIDTHKEGRILIDITTISPPYTTTSKLSRRNEVVSYRYELLIVITPSLTPLYRPLPLVADTEKGHNSDHSTIILSTKVLELLSYLKQAHHTHIYSLLMSAQALLPPSISSSSSGGHNTAAGAVGSTSINQQVVIARLWRELIEG